MKKIIYLVLVALALTGCANIKFQYAVSYKTDNLAGDLQDVIPVGGVAAAPKQVKP